MSTQVAGQSVIETGPETLAGWLRDERTVLVDVREDFEHAAEHIRGARHLPLSAFDPAALRTAVGDARVVFYCRSGKRSRRAAEQYAACGVPAISLAGGIEQWKAAGMPTERIAGAPRIDIMRQVQMTAGTLVLSGVLLGAFLSPWFLLLSGFIGAGLIFAGASGWCGMAMLLAKMPWNQASRSCAAR